jgi:hypothetical protein
MEFFGLQLVIHMLWFVALGAAAIMAPVGAAAADCEALATLKLSHVILTSARTVAPGRLVLPDEDFHALTHRFSLRSTSCRRSVACRP